ncbi:uncharacterized protein LOC144092113 [Stigmatopora argus]
MGAYEPEAACLLNHCQTAVLRLPKLNKHIQDASLCPTWPVISSLVRDGLTVNANPVALISTYQTNTGYTAEIIRLVKSQSIFPPECLLAQLPRTTDARKTSYLFMHCRPGCRRCILSGWQHYKNKKNLAHKASLLCHALDCSGGSLADLRAKAQTAEEQTGDQSLQQLMPVHEKQVPLRHKRQLERRGHAHLGHTNLPGAISVKGFPNSFIQADRSRRHLAQAANKKKNKRKSRVGSFSLLSNDKKSNPLQVIRARRQVENEKKQPEKDFLLFARPGGSSGIGNVVTRAEVTWEVKPRA